MEPTTEKSRFASLSDDDLLSKNAINTKKANERAHRTFCSYLKENNGDVNFENRIPEMLPLPCHS